MDPISNTKKMIPSRTYTGRELLSMLEGMVELNKFLVDDQVTKTNKLKGITEMIINLDEVDNTNNLEDGKPSNSLLTYHVTSNEDFTSFEPQNPQYKKLKNGEFISLFLIDDIIADETLDKHHQPLLELAISGRHRGHSLWLLTQSYTAVPNNIRRQAKMLYV